MDFYLDDDVESLLYRRRVVNQDTVMVNPVLKFNYDSTSATLCIGLTACVKVRKINLSDRWISTLRVTTATSTIQPTPGERQDKPHRLFVAVMLNV